MNENDIKVGMKVAAKAFPPSKMPSHWSPPMMYSVGEVMTVKFIDPLGGVQVEENDWFWEISDFEEVEGKKPSGEINDPNIAFSKLWREGKL
ncbi:MAG: hypothetical protein PVG39_25830 [Desulfobacteraceae bacterium]|jgi:hypothetical protein